MVQMQEILELSIAERILMMEKIWDSIDREKIEIPAAHQQELDQRIARYEKGETTFVTWESIKQELNSDR